MAYGTCYGSWISRLVVELQFFNVVCGYHLSCRKVRKNAVAIHDFFLENLLVCYKSKYGFLEPFDWSSKMVSSCAVIFPSLTCVGYFVGMVIL